MHGTNVCHKRRKYCMNWCTCRQNWYCKHRVWTNVWENETNGKSDHVQCSCGLYSILYVPVPHPFHQIHSQYSSKAYLYACEQFGRTHVHDKHHRSHRRVHGDNTFSQTVPSSAHHPNEIIRWSKKMHLVGKMPIQRIPIDWQMSLNIVSFFANVSNLMVL